MFYIFYVPFPKLSEAIKRLLTFSGRYLKEVTVSLVAECSDANVTLFMVKFLPESGTMKQLALGELENMMHDGVIDTFCESDR
ncbi:MAG: hypothetical protein AAB857_01330 [Patescibacteria group bacterium]